MTTKRAARMILDNPERHHELMIDIATAYLEAIALLKDRILLESDTAHFLAEQETEAGE